jgi:CBS domain-containing protein
MKASDIMTRTVRTATAETPVRDIARMMVRHQISAVPIIERGRRVVGIISEGDLVRRAETGTERKRSTWLDLFVDPGSKARAFVKSHARRAKDVMTRPVVSVTASTPLGDIADLLEKRRIKRVPVVRSGQLIGIVSRHDLVRSLAQDGESETTKPRRGTVSDRMIRTALDRQLKRQRWPDIAHVNVTVEKGVVEFWGAVPDESRRNALRVMAENVDGVRSVRNERLIVLPAGAYAS